MGKLPASVRRWKAWKGRNEECDVVQRVVNRWLTRFLMESMCGLRDIKCMVFFFLNRAFRIVDALLKGSCNSYTPLYIISMCMSCMIQSGSPCI